jgi:3-hydroxyisobutyrate dehydrogenase
MEPQRTDGAMDAIGVIGLGTIGGAIASHLLAAGFDVVGTDVRDDAVATLVAAGGRSARTPAEVAATADVVFTSLPSPAALHAVTEGEDGLAVGARPGVIVVETGTFALDDKQRARESLADAGVLLLDAAISGTGDQARTGDIVVLLSGDEAACARVLPVLRACSREQFIVGGFGDAARMKYLANLLVTIHNAAAAEAMALGARAGLDPAMVLEVLSAGAGNSRMLEVRGPAMVAADYTNAGIRADTFLKDVQVIGDFARSLRCPVPLFELAGSAHVAAVAQGHGHHDTSSVHAVAMRAAGMSAPGTSAAGTSAMDEDRYR